MWDQVLEGCCSTRPLSRPSLPPSLLLPSHSTLVDPLHPIISPSLVPFCLAPLLLPPLQTYLPWWVVVGLLVLAGRSLHHPTGTVAATYSAHCQSTFFMSGAECFMAVSARGRDAPPSLGPGRIGTFDEITIYFNILTFLKLDFDSFKGKCHFKTNERCH